MLRHYYLAVNVLIMLCFIAVFALAEIGDQHANPKKCFHSQLLGSKCPTCGILKGFSLIFHGDFNRAYVFQKNSIPVFSFFTLQIFMRLIIIILLYKRCLAPNMVMNIDITLTLLMFVILFRGIVLQTFYIFYKMILTGNTNL